MDACLRYLSQQAAHRTEPLIFVTFLTGHHSAIWAEVGQKRTAAKQKGFDIHQAA